MRSGTVGLWHVAVAAVSLGSSPLLRVDLPCRLFGRRFSDASPAFGSSSDRGIRRPRRNRPGCKIFRGVSEVGRAALRRRCLLMAPSGRP